MSGARLHTLLPELATRQPVMVVGAAVIDVIADAYALPWRGCDIELKQQSVNVGGCALNIAVALKRLGIEAGNALPLGQGRVGGDYSQPDGERGVNQPDR
ncbi:putative carbohydrate/pyrimidine kinase [Escherichia coli]|uniref:Putative carbohydrate/pyrimidine kinase n=1 Tax=Escherichia coli TaxID=562 RepID=A0A376VJ51_ECOLX|nr:putative carbohydrate/pyrimidine kinase [Escherichia coli]